MSCNNTETEPKIIIGNKIGIICKRYRYHYIINVLLDKEKEQSFTHIQSTDCCRGKSFDTIIIDWSGLKLYYLEDILSELINHRRVDKDSIYLLEDKDKLNIYER